MPARRDGLEIRNDYEVAQNAMEYYRDLSGESTDLEHQIDGYKATLRTLLQRDYYCRKASERAVNNGRNFKKQKENLERKMFDLATKIMVG